jgi:hypothetical protein
MSHLARLISQEGTQMSNNVSELHKPIHFTIDGRSYSTTERKQPAANLLRLAGLEPSRFDLGELKGQRPEPLRYRDESIVEIHNEARFVSIRQRADVA